MDLAGIELFGFFGIILAIATYDIVKTRREILKDRAKAAAEAALKARSNS
jgi:predicted PurR-regulated permease PerM